MCLCVLNPRLLLFQPQVSRSEQGVLQTIRPVQPSCPGSGGGGSRFYEFLLHPASGVLDIWEVEDPQAGPRLQLLDGAGGWACQLPERLRAMHSHWLCRERCTILLRPPHFRERDLDFVIRYSPASDSLGDGGSAAAQRFDCRRVPDHLRSTHWAQLELRQLPLRLVLPRECGITPVLAKFDDPAFIHAYEPVTARSATDKARGAAAGQALLVYELPRFRLGFELLPGGQLRSLDYAGYKLSACQQLVQQEGASYTLPEFTRYLLLQLCEGGKGAGNASAGQLVLVPVGDVAHEPYGGTVVVTADACDAPLQVGLRGLHVWCGRASLSHEAQQPLTVWAWSVDANAP